MAAARTRAPPPRRRRRGSGGFACRGYTRVLGGAKQTVRCFWRQKKTRIYILCFLLCATVPRNQRAGHKQLQSYQLLELRSRFDFLFVERPEGLLGYKELDLGIFNTENAKWLLECLER
jgi:hypothetical protein